MSDARWAALLFAAALLSRLLSFLGSAIFGTDSCHYLLMADWMRDGRMHDALSIAYHPLYPLLISISKGVLGSTELAGHSVSIVLGSAAALPLFLTLRDVFGRPAAILATLLYAFSPALVEVQSDVMTEGTFFFFSLSSMWLTWRMMERPSLDRAAVLGAAAAGAFLCRVEGLLAIVLAAALPLADALLRRREVPKALAGVGLTLVAAALVLSPYLLWVKAERGRWALSVRPSAVSAEQAVVGEESTSTVPPEDRARFYRIYLTSMFRLSLYGALIPFFVVGCACLRQVPRRQTLFYLSFPLGHLGGVALALRTATFMSERYIYLGNALLGGVTALGMVAALRAAARKWPDARLRPALCGAAMLLLIVLPALKAFKVRRLECRSYPEAAKWILAHGPRPTAMTGLEQVAYYCGARSYYTPREKGALLQWLDREKMDYFVYSEKELQKDPEYVAMLRSLDRLEPPVEIPGAPGTWTVYVQRVK